MIDALSSPVSRSSRPLNGSWTLPLPARVETPADAAGFGSILARRQSAYLQATADGRGDESQAKTTPLERARRAAQDFVAVSLIEPILKNLRETTQAAAPFAPGPGEKQFRGLADAQVARQIARATRFPLVDSIATTLLRGERAAVTAPSGSRP